MVDLVNEGWPEERRCADCIHSYEVCCGYGVCGAAFKRWWYSERPLRADDVLRWVEENAIDLDDRSCGMLEER